MILRNLSRQFHSPDGGGSSGDGDGGKTFTQEQLNHLLAEHKRGLQSKLDGLEKRLGDYEDMLIEAAGGEEAVNHFMETGELPEGEEGDDDGGGEYYTDERGQPIDLSQLSPEEAGALGIEGATDVSALVRGIQQRHSRELNAIKTRLDKEIQRREEVEQRNLESQRDQLLADALVKNNVIDVSAGLKLFRENMELDPDEGKWRFKTKDGLYMDPDTGIAETLPDYLRKPMTGGGSGARGSAPASVVASQLARKKEELKNLQDQATRSGNQQDIARWQSSRREVAELETSQGNRPGAAQSTGR